MERFDVIHVIFLINIYVCLPLTMAVSCWVCFVVRKEQAPITYYTNLLFSNLVQCSMMIPFIVQGNSELHGVFQYSPLIFCCAVIASVNFKMCIATERCLVITRPQWNCIRQTKGSVVLSVLVWTLSVITVPLAMIIPPVLIFFALFPSFLFILTLVWTLKALPAATSVPTEEKRRIVGTLVLLLINYHLTFFPLIFITFDLVLPGTTGFGFQDIIVDIVLYLFLLSPSMDLILFFLMLKGPINNLLVSLCCCCMDNTVGEVAADTTLELQNCSYSTAADVAARGGCSSGQPLTRTLVV
ncbi:uncharacterized protein LOC120443372 [Oreochromis aureus]|uniref:uncharacterized protein LOC120443372 n=1 Tax=Oreochromis aureus TaxID=47969 RepID=UPI00195318CD|nr:uncharacterized protein LOC120443372 [Oreochromis aureus]XP_039477908.1 uncharacterized protein LOC120443372 [Oreochromis aureus]